MNDEKLRAGSIFSNPPQLDFDPSNSLAFEVWQKKWSSWIYLSNIDDKKTIKHILFNCFTDKTLQAYLSLKLSTEEDEDADSIIDRLRDLLQNEGSHFGNRFDFLRRVQTDNETICEWIQDLEKLSKKCRFDFDCCGSCSESRIVDQVVAGIRDPDIQKKLFYLGPTTLQQIVKIIQHHERETVSQKQSYQSTSFDKKFDLRVECQINTSFENYFDSASPPIKNETHGSHLQDIEVDYQQYEVQRNSADFAKRRSSEKTNATFLMPRIMSTHSLSRTDEVTDSSPTKFQIACPRDANDVIQISDDSDDNDDEQKQKVINFRIECPACRALFGSRNDLMKHKCKKLPRVSDFDSNVLDETLSDRESISEQIFVNEANVKPTAPNNNEATKKPGRPKIFKIKLRGNVKSEKPRQVRMKKWQREELKKVFKPDSIINKTQLKQLSEKLEIAMPSIRIWIKNNVKKGLLN